MKETIAVIIGILTIIGIVFGIHRYMENRYALAQEVKQEIKKVDQKVEKTDQRLDYKILSDQSNEIQKRIWIIEDRYQKKPMEETVKEELNTLKKNSEELKLKINNIEKKSNGK